MKRFLPLLLLLVPVPALCLDMDFYTYDGFQETVDAFTRLALIFSDNAFMGFAFTFGIFGVVCGAIMFGTKAHMGQASAPLAWTLPILFGMVIFKGLIIPTGSLYIYDTVLNANQAVGGVPDIIVFIAGGLNELERDIVQVVDTGAANPYGTSGGMAGFNLIMSSAGADPDDVDLARSVAQYYADCGVWAVNTNYGGVTLQELMRGSTDLGTTFAKFGNPAISTTYYTSGNEQGTVVSCQAAWTSINTALSTASEMQSMENEICQRSGFANSNAAEMTQCDTDLSNVGADFGVAGANSQAFMRSVFLAQSMATALQSGDFGLGQSEIMNRQVMTESLGSANAMNEWIPKLRAFMTATVLGLIPLLALFMMTPLSMKSLAVVMGLFMWLFFWGIADATASIMANDAATNAFAQISHYNLGFDAIMNMPEGAVKALGIFGKSRAMALGLATLLSSSLMAFGGVALSAISRNQQTDLEGKGERSATTALLPEQRGAYLGQLSSGVASEAAAGRYGMTDVAAGNAMGSYRTAASAREMSINPSLAGGLGMPALMGALGQMDAGQQAGQFRGASMVATAEGLKEASDHVSRALPMAVPGPSPLATVAEHKTQADTETGYGETQGRSETFGADGKSMFAGGYLQGGTNAGRQLAFNDVYRNVTGNDRYTGDGFRRMGQLLEGAYEAQSQVTPNPDQYIMQQREFGKKLYAMADFLDKNPGAAEFIGRTGVLNELLQNQGFVDTLHAFGERGVRQGYAFGGESQAARGDAARSAGGTARVARETANSGVAQDLAGAHVLEALSRTFGVDPHSVRGLEVAADKRGYSAVSFSLDDSTRESTVKSLLADHQISQQQADAILAEKRAGRVTATIGADGSVLAAAIDSGSTTTYRSTDTSVVGTDSTTIHSQQNIDRESTVFDRSVAAVGGTGITAKKGATADFIVKGIDKYGKVGAPYKNQVVASYVGSFAEYGQRLGADTNRVYSNQITSQNSGEVGLRVPLIGGVGTSISDTNSHTEQISSGTGTDVGNVFFRSTFDNAYAEGEKEAAKRFGANFREGANADAANRYVAQYTEIKLQAALGNLRDAAREDAQRAVDTSKPVKAAQDP